MSLLEIFAIIFFHWLFDFVFQTTWQSLNKSTNNAALTQHVAVYAACWIPVMTAMYWIGPFTWYGAIIISLLFAVNTFVFHWGTDYCTSRLNTYLWQKGNAHNFFVSVGWDQVLHYVQLFTTYYLLKT